VKKEGTGYLMIPQKLESGEGQRKDMAPVNINNL
jgi:hypothetical protein